MSFSTDPTTTKALVLAGAILLFPFRLVVWVLIRLFGYDIDAAPVDQGGDGHSVLTFFAGLLTTQAAGLLILVQGKDTTFVFRHLLVYLAFAATPLTGIVVVVLRSTVKRRNRQYHAYNKQSISFARWTLFFGLILTLALPGLGLLGLVPGQNTRVDFSDSYIPCLPARGSSARELKGHRNRAVNEWMASQIKGVTPNPDSQRQLIVVEQDGSFAADYRDIVTSLSFGAPAIATDTRAYVIRNATEPDSMPTYVKLEALPIDEGGRMAKHVVVVKQPSKGDFVLLFLIMEKRDDTGDPLPTDPASYQFHWRVK